MALTTDKKVEAIKVAVARFINVATLIAFALIIVENTSDGINQQPKGKEIICDKCLQIDFIINFPAQH